MQRLISSGFRIMFRHSRFVWITMFASALLGTIGGFFGCRPQNLDEYQYESGMLYLTLIPVLLLILFSLVFAVGQEHSGGTLRNKLISGCRKAAVCAAWLVCSLVFALICAALYLTPFLLLSRKALRVLPANIQCSFALTILLQFLFISAAGSLFSLLFRRQAAAAFVTVTAAMLLFFAASFMKAELAREKYNETRVVKYSDPVTGSLIEGQTDSPQNQIISNVVTVFNPNPFYVDSPLRETCIILNKLNPANAILDLTGTLDSIMTGHQINQWNETREACISSLQETLKGLESSTDSADIERRLQVSAELREWEDENGYVMNEIRMLEREFNTAAGSLGGVPRCLLGVLIAFCAAGIGIFRKKDIV